MAKILALISSLVIQAFAAQIPPHLGHHGRQTKKTHSAVEFLELDLPQKPHGAVVQQLRQPQNAGESEVVPRHKGHHYRANKWMQKQSQAFIIKSQREELSKRAAGNPKMQRYDHWHLLEICTARVSSNLGGMGPDFGADHEIRYFDVGSDELGRKLDLVMTNITEYKPFQAKRNQGNPCFAVINVLHNTDVQVVFDLVYSGTSDLTTTTVFRLEDWDLDENGYKDGEEEIDVFYKFHELAKWNITDNADITVLRTKSDVEFIAEDEGGGEDNPTDMGDMERQDERVEEVDLLAGAPQLMIDLKVNGGTKGRNYMFNMEYATTMTTTCGASCVIWGDPHVLTFDEQVRRNKQHPMKEAFFRTHNWKENQVTVNQAGTFYLVKSRRVNIQGRYESNRTNPNVTNLVEVAVSGEFLRGNTLKVGIEGDKIYFNEEEILKEMPSTFYKWHASERYIAAKYHKDSQMVKNGQKGPGIDIELPEGMRMTINRWKQNLAVSISMCPQRGGQEGHCGNYNGNPDDDTATAMQQRPQNFVKIANKASLFRFYDKVKSKPNYLAKQKWKKQQAQDFHRELVQMMKLMQMKMQQRLKTYETPSDEAYEGYDDWSLA